jgi:uncharacterized membrane protein
MPDDQIFLLILAILAGILVALVLGVIAFARTRRLAALARRVEVLEHALRARPATAAARAPAVERPAGAWVPPASPQPPIPPAPSVPVGPPPTPLQTPPPAPTPLVSASEAAPPPLQLLRPAPQPAFDAPPPGPVELAPPTPRAKGLDWERWIGVRGAALVGGVLLALAGLLFVQYSVQRGWIKPPLRVAMAAAVGIAAIAGSLPLFRRGYRHPANALTGAGVVLLYGALWAGRSLYGLFGFEVAFPGMVAVTVACGAIALKRPSLAVAVFALCGGFCTPLLLSLGSERPLGLFGYLLGFDLLLIAVARRPRFGLIGLLGSIGTLAIFASFAHKLQPGDGPIALILLGLSAAALALPALRKPGDAAGRYPTLGAALALLGSYPIVLYVAYHDGMERQLVPLALLCAALQVLAGIVAERRSVPGVAVTSVLGAMLCTLAWVLSAPVAGPRAWQLAATCVGLAAIPHLLFEWRARRRGPSGSFAPAFAALSFAACWAAALVRSNGGEPAPTFAVGIVLAALLLRQAHLGVRGWLAWVSAVVPGALWLVLGTARFRAPETFSLPPGWVALPAAAVAAFALHAFAARNSGLARAAWVAVSCSAVAFVLALVPHGLMTNARLLLMSGTAVALGGFAALGAGAAGSALALLAGAGATAAVQSIFAAPHSLAPGDGRAMIALELGAAALFALTPALARARMARNAWGWVVGALAPWLWLGSLLALFADYLVPVWRAGPALGLGVLAAVALFFAAGSSALAEPARARIRTTALAAAAASAIAFASLALTLQLERGVWTVAPALAAAGMALAYRRIGHGALVTAASALLVWSTLRVGFETILLAAGEVHWPRTGYPVLHWASFGWALPALAALVASGALRGASPTRWRSIAATVCGICGLFLLFLWINLEVQNLFQTGPQLEIEFARQPARDAATSVSWGLYALGLLGAGLRGARSGLRRASLIFFLAALLKVFLLDLGNLEGLYRVASLLALAIALLAVSLLYQRFVFRREEHPEAAPHGAADQ